MIWQDLIVGLIVAACALYLARRWYGVIAGKSTGCGCSECPSKHPSPQK